MNINSDLMGYANIRKLPELLINLSQEFQKFSELDWVEFVESVKMFFLVGEIYFSVIFSICLIISGLLYIAEAMIFLKARRKSWAAVIPIYKSYVLIYQLVKDFWERLTRC